MGFYPFDIEPEDEPWDDSGDGGIYSADSMYNMIAALSEEYGFDPEELGGLLVEFDPKTVDIESLRGNVFYSPLEAMQYLGDAGVLHFSVIYRMPDGFYRAAVPEKSP